MLSDHPAIPVLAVTDIERAKQFYEGTLGLRPMGEQADGVVYEVANGGILVYPSSYAGTNKATAIGFHVPPEAFDAEIADLRSRGVTFQTYDMEGVEWADGVANMGGMKTAWFEDPDGNILNIDSSTEDSSSR
jgi:catechol 2,3-dioxygenase-like lactoylglutathione lyase family enzyme